MVSHKHQINPVTVHYKGLLSKGDRGWFCLCVICNKKFKIMYKGTDMEMLVEVESCAECGNENNLITAYNESSGFKTPEKLCRKCYKELVVE